MHSCILALLKVVPVGSAVFVEHSSKEIVAY